MKLWHDDIRIAPHGWVWATNNESAKAALETLKVTELSLDHDLGGRPGDHWLTRGTADETGYDLVQWMIDMGIFPQRINIHSLSASGGGRMLRALQAAHRESNVPFMVTRVLYEPSWSDTPAA